MATCKCGKRMSKWASMCRACHAAAAERAARAYVEAETRGTCPDHPNRPLVFNNALASSMWLQCAGYRARELGGTADCTYQILCGRDEYRRVKGERA